MVGSGLDRVLNEFRTANTQDDIQFLKVTFNGQMEKNILVEYRKNH